MVRIMKTIDDFESVLSKERWNTIHEKAWRRSLKIGEGTFGSVHIGQRVEDGMVFAVKSAELFSNPPAWPAPTLMNNLVALRNETITLSQLRCKYIIRMLGCGRSDGSNSYQADEKSMLDLFLEYIPRGSLHHLMKRLNMGATTAKTDLGSGSKNQPVSSSVSNVDERRVKRFPEDYVRAYTSDILRAVDYLHRKQFVHGDIKPMNLLVAEDCLKLADFGGCKTLKKNRLDFWVTRTAKYTAPEVFYKIEQGLASDIFSVGCTVLEMTAGFVPNPLFIPQWLSKDGQNFLRRCLTSDPSKRWTAAQLLEHPFIRDRDQNDTRPYSTIIPEVAESMILQPPPIELYTNTMFSPTWQGNRSFLPPADPEVLYQRIHQENTQPFRKEQITISSGSPSPSQIRAPEDDDTQAGTGDDSSYFSIRISTVTNIPVAASHPSRFSARTDPKSMHGDSSTFDKAATSLVSDSKKSEEYFSTNDPKDAAPILPGYKPEFEPPEDSSLHFLLPRSRPGEDKNKDDDLDTRAAALWEATPTKMKIRPSPLVISNKPTDSKYGGGRRKKPENQQKHVTMSPLPIANLSEQQLKQLHQGLSPNFRDFNEEIKQEARIAEEAGIYDNKLCPSANDEENDPRILFPTFAGSTKCKPGFISRLTNILKGYKTCKEVDSVHSPSDYQSAE